MKIMMVIKQTLIGVLFLSAVGSSISASDNVPPSQKPPKNLPSDNVPQFVVLGFDDQMTNAGMENVLNIIKGKQNPAGKGQAATFDGTPARLTFYTSSAYLNASKAAHTTAIAQGHEIGNHTNSHTTAFKTSESTWKSEIEKCNSDLVAAGVKKENIFGFRTPYLQYNNATFQVLKSMGFVYDCSIEDGWDTAQDGTDYVWPYTLDNGSPGNKVMVDWNDTELPYELLKSYPGLWEMPCYPIVVPPDSLCEKYGLQKRLRYRLKTQSGVQQYFDTLNGKITGLDYNLCWNARLDGIEIGKVLCYTLDLHYNSNRSPFNFGCHSNYYITDGGPSNMITNGIEGLKYFVDYALKKPDVRFVSGMDVIRWMRNPAPLDPNKTSISTPVNNMGRQSSIVILGLKQSQLQLDVHTSGLYTFTVFSVNGKMLSQVETKIEKTGIQSISLKLNNFTNYSLVLLTVKNHNGVATKKVFAQR